jgi:DEAD/DEAH box helicase domain-containing protein
LNRIDEYIDALVHSEHFQSQVAARHLVAGRPLQSADWRKVLSPSVIAMLQRLGFSQLYSHQLEAFKSISSGIHTVVATPTASGKTLIYNLPLFEQLTRDATVTALYVFPLKALAQDQLDTFGRWARAVGAPAPSAAIYDGDTNAYQRKKIRRQPPNVLMTNPEMVHLSLLAYHEQWQSFFKRLKYVVIDEVHTYRGMLGAHMAQTLRRLQRICRHYGACPTFIFTSATLADPGRMAGQLIDAPVAAITQSGAPQGNRHIVLIDPSSSAAQAAILMLKAAMARGLRTIVYTQSRKMAELISLWAQQRSGVFRDKIKAYRAGLMPGDRRDIEQRLKNGELLAVVSTSALELGIDIGDLDLCILVGYPGSMMSTWQRSGRVGRKGQKSALILIAAQDALDRYFMSHPESFLNGQAETGVVNPYNRVALQAHLECAAAELALSAGEPWTRHPEVRPVIDLLEREGLLRRTAEGHHWYSRRRRPHLQVHFRGYGQNHRIVDGVTGDPIGEIDAHRLYREMHPGAVYLQQGETYLVESIEPAQLLVRVRPARLDYYTRVRGDTEVEVLEIRDRKTIGCTQVHTGTLKVTDHITAYDRVQTATGQTLQQIPLQVPPTIIETQGIWFDIDEVARHRVVGRAFDFLGTLHAAEHAAIRMMPLLVLADRNDLGGLSTPFHSQTGRAAIFIYDGVPGGAGFSEQAFARADDLLRYTRQALEQCPCETGCPSCVHSPKCGSGNQPLDKAGAAFLLHHLQQSQPGVRPELYAIARPPAIRPVPGAAAKTTRFGVFDLETQCSADEVGGRHQAHRMRVSCGIVYDSRYDRFDVYDEARIDHLIDHLKHLDLVVGFNSKRFDYKVLSGYSDFDFLNLPSLDMLESVRAHLGFRLSLDHLAAATLGVRKNGTGLDALRWWREGLVDKIIDYCRMDVCLTRDLYLFARRTGYLIHQEGDGMKFRIPVDASGQHTSPRR